MQDIHGTRETNAQRDRTDTDRLVEAIADEVWRLHADEAGSLNWDGAERHLKLILRRVSRAAQDSKLVRPRITDRHK